MSRQGKGVRRSRVQAGQRREEEPCLGRAKACGGAVSRQGKGVRRSRV